MKSYIEAEIEESYFVKNIARSFEWHSDEPEELGGSDKGATPTELLLSSLASCKLITMKMYAERKGWTLGRTSIRIDVLDKVEESDKLILNKEITFPDDLNEQQMKRLTEIAMRCPVARMLKNSIEFREG